MADYGDRLTLWNANSSLEEWSGDLDAQLIDLIWKALPGIPDFVRDLFEADKRPEEAISDILFYWQTKRPGLSKVIKILVSRSEALKRAASLGSDFTFDFENDSPEPENPELRKSRGDDFLFWYNALILEMKDLLWGAFPEKNGLDWVFYIAGLTPRDTIAAVIAYWATVPGFGKVIKRLRKESASFESFYSWEAFDPKIRPSFFSPDNESDQL